MRIKTIKMAPFGADVILYITVSGDRGKIAETVREVQMSDKEYHLTIKPLRKRRSLTANSYYWELVGKLADALPGESKTRIHTHLVQEYGAYKMSGDEIAVFSIPSSQDPERITQYSRAIGYGTIKGRSFTHYAVLKGSSTMDSKEFSRLLDGAIAECKDMGIETLPPEQIARLQFLKNNGIFNGRENGAVER